MNKGFTLIELLAVIVILAIIALIATPIVLNIINESKENARLRSAEMYIKGLETSVATATLHNKTIKDDKYNILEDGNICIGTVEVVGEKRTCNGETLKVEMNGEVPSGGSVTIENGQIKDIELTYSDNKTIVKDSAGSIVYQKTFEDICKYVSGTAKTAGAKYSCEVKPGTSYNFYVLTTPAEGDTTINLIMDRNICEDGTPATSENTCLVAYNSSGDAAGIGPVTAMTYLNNATSSWENIDNLDLTYDDEGNYFEDFVLNGKARLPYKSEVSDYDSTNKTNAYLYDYLKSYDNIQTNVINEIGVYWTLSSVTDFSRIAWHVSFIGRVVGDSVDNDVGADGSGYGVRPVITLKLQ